MADGATKVPFADDLGERLLQRRKSTAFLVDPQFTRLRLIPVQAQ
jgi:hypothetical protein